MKVLVAPPIEFRVLFLSIETYPWPDASASDQRIIRPPEPLEVPAVWRVTPAASTTTFVSAFKTKSPPTPVTVALALRVTAAAESTEIPPDPDEIAPLSVTAPEDTMLSGPLVDVIVPVPVKAPVL